MLEVQGVGKRYGSGPWVLREVDLEVAGGHVVSVVGGNGSGKSTLLRVLVGLTSPSSGIVSGLPDVVGYVPDRFPPHERLSAVAYLTHMGRVRGLGTSDAARAANALLDRLALVGGRRSQLRTLSKGNMQKVALAQALLVEPQLLVLDEPWSGLDKSAHGVLAEIVEEVASAGGAVVYTDHEESTATLVPSRRLLVRSGRVSEAETPAPSRVPYASARNDAAVPPTVEVTLRARRDRPAHHVDWASGPGIHDVDYGEHETVIVVDPVCSDSVLLSALNHGWSVVTVGPCATERAEATR